MSVRQASADIIPEYKIYLIEHEKSRATVEKYLRDVQAFFRWAGNRYVDKSFVLEYKEMLKKGYCPSSVNSMLSSLNSFFRYIGRDDLKVRTVKRQRKLFYDSNEQLTKEEYNRMVDKAKAKGKTRLFYVLQTLCCTGIRVSELKYITVEAVQNGKAEIQNKGKTREILLPRNLCKKLWKYIRRKAIKTGPVFVTRTGKPLDRSNIWTEVKKLCKEAKVSPAKAFPHNLRHLFARTFYAMKKDIVRLADILGHASINTTRIYTMETSEVHRKELDKLGLLRC